MSKPVRDESLTINVRDVNEGGKHLAAEIPEADVAEMIGGGDQAYRTVGQPAQATFDLTRINDTVSVQGSVTVPLGFSCSRCLNDNIEQVSVSLHWTFLPADRYRARATSEEEVELTSEDLDVSFYEKDEIDLREVVREAVLLELTAYPVCPTPCQLVTVAGEDKAESKAKGDKVDPRWAPLLALRSKQRS